MDRTKFTDQQILFALKQVETGIRVDEVCRKMGISEATFYDWKNKYAGLDINEPRQLKQLQDENGDLNNKKSKSIIANDKYLFFGYEDFNKKIVKGDCCFMCGIEQGSKPFNFEHVIPQWILKRYDLYDKYLTLTNGAKIRYRSYTIPCCQECNTFLGMNIEKPISELFRKSYSEINEILVQNPDIFNLAYIWMCLIFIKTHLKDKHILVVKDRREDKGKIADTHDWQDLHHIHSMARCIYTQANVEQDVFGSMLFFHALEKLDGQEYDFCDSSYGKSMLVRLGDSCIVAVLNDSCAGSIKFDNTSSKLTGSLIPIQLREIQGHLDYINVNLKKRTVFFSTMDDNEYTIRCKLPPTIDLQKNGEEVLTLGECIHGLINNLPAGDMANYEKILEEVKAGTRQFLFDEKGEFMDYSKARP